MKDSLNWQTMRFNELSLVQLYQIMSLRSAVFVVEQNCVYQDLDGKDQDAIHVCGFLNDKIVAYSRLFSPGYYFEDAAIGRVLVAMEARNYKLGHVLMEKSIAAVCTLFSTSKITISAQVYLLKFYQQHGFVQVGEEYLEDGIPHIEMQRDSV